MEQATGAGRAAGGEAEVGRLFIEISGVVQGVGFRPFVYALAVQLGLSGFVRNQGGKVEIEVEGRRDLLDRFIAELRARPPPLAQVEHLGQRELAPLREVGFRIEVSDAGLASEIGVSADIATCDACLSEVRDPANRRYRYPFTNCTQCGPRLTIVREAPYDRARTTMAGFALCADCQREYDDPGDRRFHAQPIACPACGPSLTLLEAKGSRLAVIDPLQATVARLAEGQIGAVKGVGGYHLVVDAQNEAAVGALRVRKSREAKPLAVMVASLDAAELLGVLNDAERSLLTSRERPIVVAARREGTALAPSVAPGSAWLGLMLPDSPLQHLLLESMAGVPLVMTSANRSDEPIAFDDADALARLAGIADFLLTHDRPIHTRCDDSVTRVIEGVPLLLRRARGFAPRPLRLPHRLARPTLALGGQLKSTFALGRDHQAIVSHHLGDLDELEAHRAYRETLDRYRALFRIEPERVVHDLHPDYATTRLALEFEAGGLERVAVQHHHAHFAGVLAEHAIDEPAIGAIFDGAGYGLDGTVWGGEFLVGRAGRSERAGHLRAVRMPGGGRAAREGWRMAAAHLADAGLPLDALRRRRDDASLRTVTTMIERGINSPWTSSVGRLFDAVACLAGGPERVSFEGQAAIWLESESARSNDAAGHYRMELSHDEHGLILDARPLIREVVADAARGVPPPSIGQRFHAGLAAGVAAMCSRLADNSGAKVVALSGGVFVNALLTCEVKQRLTASGLRMITHARLPSNDGGLSWGQLAVVSELDRGG